MDRLDAAAIEAPGLEVRVVDRCSSTNELALRAPLGERPLLVAAEEQSAGRGRRGRRWHSARGAGLTFSLARRMARPARELPGLALAAGVAAARALRSLGVAPAALKWPNDLEAGGAKLGGILVETRADAGATRAVIGIGINCRRDPALAARLRRPVASLEELVSPLPARNALIAAIARALLESLEAFDARGLEAVRSDWEAMDAHAGRRLRVRLGDGRVLTGVASGLAEDGRLRLATRRGLRVVTSGRVVSSRPA